MATIEEYRENWIKQFKSTDTKIDALAAQVETNTQDIEYNAEAIEEIAEIIGGQE